MKARAVSHIVSFLEALASERGASVNTIDAYRRDLADYEADQKGQGHRRAEGGHELMRWRIPRGPAAQSWARASLVLCLSAIRQFHGFLYAEGWRRDNPTLAVEGPRRSRPLPKLLSLARSSA